jgi:hypothetical protein
LNAATDPPHVEMKGRLRSRRYCRQVSRARVIATDRVIARFAVADKLTSSMTLIGWPVTLKIIEKRRPVMRQKVGEVFVSMRHDPHRLLRYGK